MWGWGRGGTGGAGEMRLRGFLPGSDIPILILQAKERGQSTRVRHCLGLGWKVHTLQDSLALLQVGSSPFLVTYAVSSAHCLLHPVHMEQNCLSPLLRPWPSAASICSRIPAGREKWLQPGFQLVPSRPPHSPEVSTTACCWRGV